MVKMFFWMFLVALASATTIKKSKLEPVCDRRSRQVKNCLVENGPYSFLFNKDKILIYDSVWRRLTDLPLKGEHTEWERVEIKKLGPRFLVELEIWTEPAGPVKLQTLKWFVFEAKGPKLEKQVEESIRRRTVKADEKPTESEKKLYIFDPLEKYGVQLSKKEIHWTAGRKSGSF